MTCDGEATVFNISSKNIYMSGEEDYLPYEIDAIPSLVMVSSSNVK